MAKLSARSAFITGGSSGIGAALARGLAAQGVHVAIAARREQALQALASEIEAQGGRATPVVLDVSDATAVKERMLAADDALEGIDLVIANAGIASGRWSGKLDYDADCAQMLATNVLGATATLTALIPRMVERKAGHLVGISSIAAYRGLPKYAAYAGTKAYLSTFLEGVRIDLRKVGIAVTDVRPGYVATELNEGAKGLPMIMSAQDAAASIIRALASRKTVHAFPFPIASAMRTMTTFPNALYDRVMGR